MHRLSYFPVQSDDRRYNIRLIEFIKFNTIILVNYISLASELLNPLQQQISIVHEIHFFISLSCHCNELIEEVCDEHRESRSRKIYRVFIKYCVFSLKFCDFSELCQFCCSACVLPAWCVYTHWTPRENRVRNILKSLEKTQYLMNTLYNRHLI